MVLVAAFNSGSTHGQPLGGQVPIYVEYSPAAQELADRATRLSSQGRAEEAAEIYQQILKQYTRKLMPLGDGSHTDASNWARQQIASVAQTLAAYRRLYTDAAQHELDEAGSSLSSADALERVTWLFPLCEPALEAALSLGALHLEAGDFVAAAAVLNQFSDHPDLPQHEATWRHLQAAAALFDGDDSRYHTHPPCTATTR